MIFWERLWLESKTRARSDTRTLLDTVIVVGL